MIRTANNFQYTSEPFHLSTVNRQKTFYYRITKPREVWGNFHTQIAFYDNANQLVYHRQGCFAHAIEVGCSDLGFVKWSMNGDALLFFEFRRGHIEDRGIYHYLLIDLTEKIVYRLDSLKNYSFSKTDIINQIIEMGIGVEKCFTDKILFSPLKWLIGIERWRPADRL